MSKEKLAEKWQGSTRALKAVQVAFDLDEKFQYSIRAEALKQGYSPSDMIRHILDLPVSKKPKRPRLTVSLTQDDYALLAQKFNVDASEQLLIKRLVLESLVEHVNTKDK